MYFNKYQKYLLKNEYQQGGKYGFSYTYNNKIYERQFSKENQELIQKAINKNLKEIDIEHEINDGPNKGNKVIYLLRLKNFLYINLLKITDGNKIENTVLNYTFKITGPVPLPVIPDLIKDKEYSTIKFCIFT